MPKKAHIVLRELYLAGRKMQPKEIAENTGLTKEEVKQSIFWLKTRRVIKTEFRRLIREGGGTFSVAWIPNYKRVRWFLRKEKLI